MRRVTVLLAAACGLFALFGAGGAGARPLFLLADVQHGISFTKGCSSPTAIGSPYSCSFSVRNNVDEAQDTLTMSSLVDVVHAAGGDVSSGPLFSTLKFDSCDLSSGPCVQTTATCSGVGITGTGTRDDPWTNATMCSLPFNSRINIQSFSHYTVQAGDFGLPGHVLLDDGSLTWHDLCNDPAHTGNTNCNPNPPNVGAGSSSQITQLASTTATTIHNAAHGPVTVVEAPATVHDFVSVTGQPGHPTPTGNVTVDFFTNNQCTGGAAATSPPISLLANGTVDATSFAQGPLGPGLYGFLAHYGGDPTYAASNGLCEPLRVVDANIQLTPATAANAVGTNHTLHCHINVNDGTGPVNAPDGTICTVTIISGPGTPISQNCTIGNPTPGSGSCDVVITSSTVGTSVIRASTNVAVAGLVLHRETGDAHVGDGPNASKAWVDANIQISPATATNAVGSNHVLTITVNAIGGTIDAGPHTATASIVSGPGGFVGSPTCTYTGGAATATCQVTITSTSTGTTVVQATSNIPVNGVVIPRTTATNPGPGGSGNASKAWVDANIQISPATATNAVGSNHVLTITVNAIGGTIDAGPHTATASIVSGPGGFVGSPTCTYTGGAATATCQVTITSTSTGTTVVQATSNIPVNGVVIPRTTATNPGPGGSGNASKAWVDANIQISPATATNAVGSNHVLTITVNAIGGTIDAGPHTATASIVSGPGGFVGSPTCTYTGGAATATCQVTITSTSTGTTVVQATSNIPVNGVVIPRTTATNPGPGGSGNASKAWVDANIQISPATATNAVGSNHVLTITVNAIGGTIDAGPHTATASIVSGPGGFVGSPTCTYTGGAATATCQVTITSTSTGTTVVQATSNIPVNGVVIPRTTATNPGPGGSGNASKAWVDANIQITPSTATNPIGTNHVLTITVNAINGTIDAGPHTATASIVSGPGSFVGSPTCTYTGGAATATCQVTITSGVGGTTVVQATSDIPVNGVVITRTTGTAANTASGGSGNASKTWLTPQGIIAPTQVSCSDFVGGSAPTLDAVNYTVVGGKIGQGINPGVFFFYTKITTTTPNQVVTVSQSNTSTNNTPLFGALNGQAILYTANCNKVASGTVTGPNDSGASFTVATPGDYVIGIKYQTKTIAGAPAPVPANITYNFSTSLGGTTGGSVLLRKS